MSLLEVNNLKVSFPTPDGMVRAVRDVSFAVDSGQTLGLVGESGSGKSVATQTIVGLTRGGQVSGRAFFRGRDLLTLARRDLRSILGVEIGMIFQDPLSSLHPYYRAGWQITEMVRAHEDVSKKAARARAIELLGVVGIPQPETRVDAYPHQLSGGMRQRVMIAMAMALNPTLLIADEPTTALDVTVQAQVLALMRRLQEEYGTAIIMITHDLGVIADIADEVVVMYAGEVVEHTDRRTVYYAPHHPYTRGLLRSLPGRAGPPGEQDSGGRLDSIYGQPPSLIQVPPGCPFHPRCPFVMDRCLTDDPPLLHVDEGFVHQSACWLPADQVGVGAEVDERRHETAEANRAGGDDNRARLIAAKVTDAAGGGAAQAEGDGTHDEAAARAEGTAPRRRAP